MKKFFFMEPVIESLSQKKLLQEIFSGFMKALAILTGILTLWMFFKAFEIYQYLDFGQKILYFLFSNLITLFAGYIIFQILWIRSENIRNETNEEYKAIPIFKYIIKAFGEVYSAAVISIGFSSMILIWAKMGRGSLFDIIPNLGFATEDPFIAGLLVFLSAIIISAIIIFVTYYLAELTIVLVDMAKNIREINKKTS